MGTVRELRDFLIEAELDHYYSAFRNELKIATIPQLKYVDEEDLVNIGMTKPEMRRLKKYYKKECPQGKLEKFKRVSTQYMSQNGEKTVSTNGPQRQKTCLWRFANTDADQPVHPCSLISAFDIHYLESIICKLGYR